MNFSDDTMIADISMPEGFCDASGSRMSANDSKFEASLDALNECINALLNNFDESTMIPSARTTQDINDTSEDENLFEEYIDDNFFNESEQTFANIIENRNFLTDMENLEALNAFPHSMYDTGVGGDFDITPERTSSTSLEFQDFSADIFYRFTIPKVLSAYGSGMHLGCSYPAY
ncbi:CLUMA_CG010831, isoform A [Clunio marinus]|uniref:CLUMA_CG010831, isoform A n=1 Tax=Clunio marinus TaxID=568069 RepID=A0A1J1ICG2_9DIPT|nr:CLUMA_CG010831, isoform A [Clunio marinus]